MIACLHDAIRPEDWKPDITKDKVQKLLCEILIQIEKKGDKGWKDLLADVCNLGDKALAKFDAHLIAAIYYGRNDRLIAALLFLIHLMIIPEQAEKLRSIETRGEKESISRKVFDKYASSPGKMSEDDLMNFLENVKDLIPQQEKNLLEKDMLSKAMERIRNSLHVKCFDPECFVSFLNYSRILEEAQIAVLKKRCNIKPWGINECDILCFMFGRRSLCLIEAIFNILDKNNSSALEECDLMTYFRTVTKNPDEILLYSAVGHVMNESDDIDQKTLFMNFSKTNAISLSDFKTWYAIYTHMDAENFMKPLEKMFLFSYFCKNVICNE